MNRQNKRRHADNCQILLAVFRERAGGVALLGLWIARLHTHQWYICFGLFFAEYYEVNRVSGGDGGGGIKGFKAFFFSIKKNV